MLIMVVGIIIGYLLRKRKLTYIPHILTFLIWLLLFFLGASIGNNQSLMSSLGSLGIEAAVISIFCMLGSMGGAYLLMRYCKSRKNER